MKTISINFEDAVYDKLLTEFVKERPIPTVDEIGTKEYASAEDYLKALVKGYIKTLYIDGARRTAKTSVEGTITTAAAIAEGEIDTATVNIK